MKSRPVPPALRRALIVPALVVASLLAWPLFRHTLDPDGHRLIDLEVYRTAGRAVLDGVRVYDFRTPENLPFTYPPTAAWMAIPLAFVPLGPLGVLWTALQVAILAVVVAVLWRPTWQRFGAPFAVLLMGGLVWIFPSRDNVVLGQINFVLLALVAADLLPRRTRWPRGLLVGVATAIKLTPGLFVPYLWLTGRRRAAYTAAATFGGLALATWVALPEDSSRYWLHEMWDPHRIGNNHFTANQSLRGLVLHFRWRGLPGAVVLGALVLLTLVLVLTRAPRLFRAGDEMAALAVVGLGTNLLSPVAWVHHTVWFLLAIPVLVHDWRRPRRAAIGAALVGLLAYKTIYVGAGLARSTDLLPFELVGRILQSSFTLAALALVAFLPAREEPTAEGVGSDDRDRSESAAREPAYDAQRQPA